MQSKETVKQAQNKATQPGIVVVDKPNGMSSNQLVQKIKRLFNVQKAGHAGTLDPFATGLMVVLLNGATKCADYLLSNNKRYLAKLACGVTTTTYDTEGDVLLERPIPPFSKADLLALCQQFEGQLQQVPPMFSALKHQGQPLYKYARRGVKIDKPARDITIFHCHLLDLAQTSFDIDVKSSKGTYIRSLAYDMGEVLGCGAHLAELRRIESGRCTAESMHTLDSLYEAENPWRYVIDIKDFLSDWPQIILTQSQYEVLLQGKSITQAWPEKDGEVLLMLDQKTIALGRIESEQLVWRKFL